MNTSTQNKKPKANSKLKGSIQNVLKYIFNLVIHKNGKSPYLPQIYFKKTDLKKKKQLSGWY